MAATKAKQPLTETELIEIIELVADGENVADACQKTKHSTASFYRYLPDYPELEKLYARVKQAEVEQEIDNIKKDEQTMLAYVTGSPEGASAIVQAFKVIFENRKWKAGKLKSHKYGEKVDVTSGGEKIQAIQWQVTPCKGSDDS